MMMDKIPKKRFNTSKSIDCALDINEDENFGFYPALTPIWDLFIQNYGMKAGMRNIAAKLFLVYKRRLKSTQNIIMQTAFYTICKHLALVFRDTEPEKSLEYLHFGT